MPEISLCAPNSWPWWLWAEHGLLGAIIGWKAASIWRARCRQAVACSESSQSGIPKAKPTAPSSATKVATASTSSSSLSASVPSLDSAPIPSGHALAKLSEAALSALEQLKQLAGPQEVLTWPDVVEAPAATMDVSGLSEGQVASYRDGRGAIYKFKLAPAVCVNLYRSSAGSRRSGDLHDCAQYDVVLAGRTRLRLMDPHSGCEVVREYGPHDFIVIPARTPHLFEFLEDNCLLEWWGGPFRAWYYKPYRSIIEAGAPLEPQQQQPDSHPPPPQPQPPQQ